MVICLERGVDLHLAQLMPLPLTVSCFSKIQIGFTFLVLARPGSPGQRAIKWVCVLVMEENVGIRWTLFLWGGSCHSCDPTNSVKALKEVETKLLHR